MIDLEGHLLRVKADLPDNRAQLLARFDRDVDRDVARDG